MPSWIRGTGVNLLGKLGLLLRGMCGQQHRGGIISSVGVGCRLLRASGRSPVSGVSGIPT